MKKFILIFCAFLLASQISACQTTKGFGKDLEKLGEKISTTSDKVTK